MKGLITAIRTLTIIPVRGKESEDLSSSIPWFPVVGLLLGLVIVGTGLVWARFIRIDWTVGVATLFMAAEISLTGGLHLDGLADWADAIGGHQKRKEKLSIMKDSHLGTFGALALMMALLAKWVAFGRLFSSGTTIWILAVFIISRDMMVELISTLPYARSGEGMAKAFIEGVSLKKRIWSHAISLCICLCFGPLGIALFGVGWLITKAMGIYYQKGFGGITGDLLGATNEILEITLLMICALPGGLIFCYTGWGWLL